MGEAGANWYDVAPLPDWRVELSGGDDKG